MSPAVLAAADKVVLRWPTLGDLLAQDSGHTGHGQMRRIGSHLVCGCGETVYRYVEVMSVVPA